jgi:hypothetical protein
MASRNVTIFFRLFCITPAPERREALNPEVLLLPNFEEPEIWHRTNAYVIRSQRLNREDATNLSKRRILSKMPGAGPWPEIHCSDMRLARRGSILFVLLKATEVLPMILGRASALKQVANNIMMQTGSLIACACVVCAQNRLTILSSPTAGTDERLGGSHAETPAERIPTASPWR